MRKTTPVSGLKGAYRASMVRFSASLCGIVCSGLARAEGERAITGRIGAELAWLGRELSLSRAELGLVRDLTGAFWREMRKKTRNGLQRTRKMTGEYRDWIVTRREYVLARLNEPLTVLRQCTNTLCNRVEAARKLTDTQKLVEDTRNRAVYTPFYLCSWHKDPARDHAEWQGRVYVDERWEELTPESDLPAVRAYVRNHKCPTVQWVMGPPVYMVTRPNCRHRLLALPIGEVLKSSAPALLKAHSMRYGREGLTPAERTLKSYREEYAFDRALWDVMPCPELAKRLKRDKRLVRKWAAIVG